MAGPCYACGRASTFDSWFRTPLGRRVPLCSAECIGLVRRGVVVYGHVYWIW